MPDGRILIAPDDGPLEASPTWVRIDDTDDLVAQIQIDYGRQSEDEKTDTGNMTVMLNDTTGAWDPSDSGQPWFGVLDGKQIMCQLYNPISGLWESQFRGRIDYSTWVINPATDRNGRPIVANVALECSDMFDYLAGIQMVPGHFGNTPPAGSEATIFYEDTAVTVGDPVGRIVQLLTDAGIPSGLYVVFTGNVSIQETKYDPGDALLIALRDACDAEIPLIANMYVDRHGNFVFHGRESRFDPFTVAASSGGAWDFNFWAVGDAIARRDFDPDTVQIRVLQYSKGTRDLINAALCWPQGLPQAEVPDNIYVDATSIDDYGYHGMDPQENLIVKEGTTTGNDAKTECAKYAQLHVVNRKDPIVRPQLVQLKSIRVDHPAATKTWDALTKADISDMMEITVGYPGGTRGLFEQDHFVEGVHKTIEPLNPGYDYVEASYDLTPAEWSQDQHGVFAGT